MNNKQKNFNPEKGDMTMSRSLVGVVKRTIDIFFGSALLGCALPFIAVLVVIVKLTSRGPVFYKQKRTGIFTRADNRPQEFYVYKFRTMLNNAEASTGPVLADEQANSITRVGRILRQTRLDELPQLFNVVKGDMSIVGPRPERPEMMGSLVSTIPFFDERMRYVKPGITGLAQIKLSYRGGMGKDSELARLKNTLVNPFNMKELEGAIADDMRLKLLYDLAYSTSLERFWSFIKTDLSIMLRTPLVMFIYRTGQ